jgi:hypothetical protein
LGYAALFDDRNRRFEETVYGDAQALLARARANLGVEQVGILGGETNTATLVEVVETLEETHVAFSVFNMDETRIIVILSAFNPDAEFSQWELVDQLPTRPVRFDNGEICYRILSETPERSE